MSGGGVAPGDEQIGQAEQHSDALRVLRQPRSHAFASPKWRFTDRNGSLGRTARSASPAAPTDQRIHLIEKRLAPRPALLQVVLQLRKGRLFRGSYSSPSPMDRFCQTRLVQIFHRGRAPSPRGTSCRSAANSARVSSPLRSSSLRRTTRRHGSGVRWWSYLILPGTGTQREPLASDSQAGRKRRVVRHAPQKRNGVDHDPVRGAGQLLKGAFTGTGQRGLLAHERGDLPLGRVRRGAGQCRTRFASAAD